jgi:transposase
MQDRQLYQQILGITSPWSVGHVELDLKQGEVRVFVEHADDAAWPCAECGRICPLHDHDPVRGWRHLDTCQYRTVLHSTVPRTKCPEHGVKTVRVPWAEPHSRFTALFERLVIDWLLAASQSAVAARMEISLSVSIWSHLADPASIENHPRPLRFRWLWPYLPGTIGPSTRVPDWLME